MLPSHPEMASPDPAGTLFTIFVGVFFVAAVIWGVVGYVRRRDLLLLCIAGGLIANFAEPILDVVALIYWPADTPLTVYTAFEREIPALIPMAYGLYVGPGSFVVYRLMRDGAGKRRLWQVFLALAAIDAFFVYPGVLLDVLDYYGDQPYEVFGFPLWWTAVDAASRLVGGWLLLVLAPRMVGWGALLAVATVPCSYIGVQAFAAWPVWLVLNSDVSTPVSYLAATCTIAIGVGIAWLIIDAVTRTAPALPEPLQPKPLEMIR